MARAPRLPRAPRPRKPGAWTLWTPELQQAICDAVQAGSGKEDAAILAGVSRATIASWMTRGREGKAPFVGFLEAMDRAEAEFKRRAITEVIRAGNRIVAPDGTVVVYSPLWQRWAWLLRTRYPREYGGGAYDEARVQSLESSTQVTLNLVPRDPD